MTTPAPLNNVIVVTQEIDKQIKTLQTLTPQVINSNRERVDAVVELLLKLSATHLIESEDHVQQPKVYTDIINGHVGRVLALKSKQKLLQPIFDKARAKLLKEQINPETPLSILEIAKFITSDFDYHSVDPKTPAGEISAEQSAELIKQSESEKASANLEAAAINGIDTSAEIVANSAAVVSDKVEDFVEDIKEAVAPTGEEPPAGEHHMNLTDGTSISAEENTGLVYFYNKDGEIVGEGKIKRMFSRWRDTALAWLDAVWSGIKTALIAAASAVSVLAVGVGLGVWQIIKSPWLAWKANREIRAGEFDRDPRLA